VDVGPHQIVAVLGQVAVVVFLLVEELFLLETKFTMLDPPVLAFVVGL